MIPKSVRNIATDAFDKCNNLVITCYKDSYAYSLAGGLFASDEYRIPFKIISETENSSDDSKQNNITPAKKGTPPYYFIEEDQSKSNFIFKEESDCYSNKDYG